MAPPGLGHRNRGREPSCARKRETGRRPMRSAIRLIVVGVLASSVSLVPALAGEVTGNGMKSDFSQGHSFCKFSGLNDIPEGDETQGPAGRTQSFGQENRLG